MSYMSVLLGAEQVIEAEAVLAAYHRVVLLNNLQVGGAVARDLLSIGQLHEHLSVFLRAQHPAI